MRTDKHKLCTVAYTDTVATCATAHVLVWRCRESLVGVIPYSLLSHTPREKQTPCGGPCPRPPAEPPAADQRAPPSQQPSTALVAAARASLDVSELQDDRGSKRDALARTPPPCHRPRERPPPPADARKRPATRGGACLEAALARAAPAAEPEVQPITADNYAAAALAAAANPHPHPAWEASAPGTPPTDPQRCPSQRPRPPRRPHWRSPCTGARLALPAADTVPTLPHAHTFIASPHPLPPTIHTAPQPRRRLSPRLSHRTAPPDPLQPYPTAPFPPPPSETASTRRAASPRSLTPCPTAGHTKIDP